MTHSLGWHTPHLETKQTAGQIQKLYFSMQVLYILHTLHPHKQQQTSHLECAANSRAYKEVEVNTHALYVKQTSKENGEQCHNSIQLVLNQVTVNFNYKKLKKWDKDNFFSVCLPLSLSLHTRTRIWTHIFTKILLRCEFENFSKTQLKNSSLQEYTLANIPLKSSTEKSSS